MPTQPKSIMQILHLSNGGDLASLKPPEHEFGALQAPYLKSANTVDPGQSKVEWIFSLIFG